MLVCDLGFRGLRYQDCLFVPEGCREDVLREFHSSHFAVHPGGHEDVSGPETAVLVERDEV